MIVEDSIQSTQNVKFVLDNEKDLRGLADIDFTKYHKALVFVDSSVTGMAHEVRKYVGAKIPCEAVVVSVDNETKELSNFDFFVSKLHDNFVDSSSLVIVVGGGTIMDAVGFAASVYIRGIPLMFVPTTLIGQVDAASGGKTCIDYGNTKNILGTLYMPELVYNNTTFLDSLSGDEIRQGLSEMFKYGLLGSQSLIDMLLEHAETYEYNSRTLLPIIEETIKVRLKIRKRHPLASNLGHTFGHAIEQVTNHSVKHGDAITMGTRMALSFSVHNDILHDAVAVEIIKHMEKLGLHSDVRPLKLDPYDLFCNMMRDKKNTDGRINLVLINGIGMPLNSFCAVELDAMRSFVEQYLNGVNG